MYSLGKTILTLASTNGLIDRKSRSYSRDLYTIIKLLLHENPDKRPTAKDILNHSFFNE